MADAGGGNKPVGGDRGNVAGGGATGENLAGGRGGGGAQSGPQVVLPPGSREVSDIVNLVDADAAAELDDYLSNGMSSLARSVNLFLTYYEERYDFVFLFTDHKVMGGKAAGRFATITSQPSVGTGSTGQYLIPGFRTNGRIKGAMAVELGSGPLSHEIGHYWAVFLDEKFGFGAGKTYSNSAHWGYAGVNGVLGGFEPQSLSCQTPLGATPMNCTPMADGRYRYVVKAFSPGGNALPYAPLELYLMGLAALDEVPAEIPVLQDAVEVADGFDPNAGTEVIDAAGISVVKMADITARHGVVTPLPESGRHFTAAFALVSATPAADEAIAEVAQRAAAFGDRGMHPLTHAFASDTGRRATMDTALGPRRSASDPPPPPRPTFSCDVLGEGCGAGLACYNGSICAIPGNAPVGAACSQGFDCVAGATCVFLGTPRAGQCLKYCDAKDASSPHACASLCTSVVNVSDAKGNIIATVCGPT